MEKRILIQEIQKIQKIQKIQEIQKMNITYMNHIVMNL